MQSGSATRAAAEVGANAEFEDAQTGERSVYLLVPQAQSDVAHGRLSVESPVGRALVGRRAGETIVVVTPKGRRRLRLIAVR